MPKKTFFQIFERPAVFFLLLLLIGVLGLHRWRSERARDYYQFWVVGQAIRSMELSNIYSLEDRQRIGEHFLEQAQAQNASPAHLRAAAYRRVITPAGTPFLYAVFYLISTGNYDFDYSVFRLFSIIAYVLSIAVLGHLLGMPRFLTLLLIVLLTEYFAPFRLDVMEGNINGIQVGMVSLLIWLRSRKSRIDLELISGFLCGLLTMLKPNLAFVGILLLGGTLLIKSMRATFIQAGGMALGALIGFGLPLILFGKVCNWIGWKEALPYLVLLPRYFYRSFLSLFFHTQSLRPFFLLAACLTAFPLLAWKIRFPMNKGSDRFGAEKNETVISVWNPDYILIGLGICAYLLSSTLVHYHYFLLNVPLLLLLFKPATKKGRFWRLENLAQMFLGLAILSLMILRTKLTGEGTEFVDSDWRLAYIGTLLLYAFGLFHLLRLRRIDSPTAKG